MHKFKYDIEKETGIPWKKKKSYRYLYTLACQKGVILRAFKRMKRGKSDRKDIQMVEEDLDGWVEKIQKIIQNTKPAGWKVENPELEFKPPKHNPVIIKEAGKTRVIYVDTARYCANSGADYSREQLPSQLFVFSQAWITSGNESDEKMDSVWERYPEFCTVRYPTFL